MVATMACRGSRRPSLQSIIPMNLVDDYLAKAADWEAVATATADGELKKRYLELAAGYRLLAAERQRILKERAGASRIA